MNFFPTITVSFLLFTITTELTQGQTVHEYKDSLVISGAPAMVVVNRKTGKINYRFSNGAYLSNTVAYLEDSHMGRICTTDFRQHSYTLKNIKDSMGTGIRIDIKHENNNRIDPGVNNRMQREDNNQMKYEGNNRMQQEDNNLQVSLIQHIILYNHVVSNKIPPYLLLSLEAVSDKGKDFPLETRNISPLAVLPSQNGHLFVPGKGSRILDVPFDNDDWVPVLERKWKEDKKNSISGISYEFSSVYDNGTMSGLVAGSVTHDFWKTGIAYQAGIKTGEVDSLNIFGGAATPDDPSLPAAYGGRDGTHDHAPHGTMKGTSVHSPVIYLCGTNDIRKAFVGFGETNARLNGRLSWKGYAPVYWNSFGVEDVLGYRGIMLPAGVSEISDRIHSLRNFNAYAKPVLSIDSYDQTIYSTKVLSSISKYGAGLGQQMGFYFIPFSMWIWKNSFEQTQIPGTGYALRDVVLRDKDNQPIRYKEGDWGAYALDPTHPAVRQMIINQLLKAKAIRAKFIKIDFLTGGALESTSRYDPTVRSGMQAYNRGMKMLKQLIDSIMGPDIFITQAISPMFPSQYAHTRFISTDVYSHLRDDQPGFPNWGSTEASLATGSHLWWVQNTLWPYTNLDVCIMKNFQKNPELSEREVKVRIYAMMVMGSILGDGSDLRNQLAADRAKKFLNNPAVNAFFSNPKVFTPLKFADGETFDQQISFYLKGDTTLHSGTTRNKYNNTTRNKSNDTTLNKHNDTTLNGTATLLALFNFSRAQEFTATCSFRELGLKKGKYTLRDFMTGELLGSVEKDQDFFSLTVPKEDACLVKIMPVLMTGH